MDKMVYFSAFDSADVFMLSFRISVRDFPVVELLEFDVNGVWVDDFSSLKDIVDSEFAGRISSFLDDDNMRIVLDIMTDGDVFVSGRYSLKVAVDSFEIMD